MAFSMAPRRPIGAPDLASSCPPARPNPGLGRLGLPARARFQASIPGVSSGGYGAFQRARDGRDCGHAITCAVMSLIAGGTSVMDLIHCDEFIAQGRTSSRAPSCSATTSAASVDLSKPRLMISTNSIAPQGPPTIWSPGAVLRGCCGLCSLVEPRQMHHTLVIFGSSLLGTCVCVITAAACAGVCMVLLIVFSQCFPDSSVQNFRRNFAVVMGPCTSRYGPKVSRNLGGFLRNNETKFGWVLNETWTQANSDPWTLGVREAGTAWTLLSKKHHCM